MTATTSPTSPRNSQRPKDDLFESTRMSFGEHLEELRRVLVKSLIGIGVGTAIGLMVATQVVAFLTKPLERAVRKFEQGLSIQRLAEQRGWLSPDLKKWLTDDSRAPQTVMVDPQQLIAAIEPYLSGQAIVIDRNAQRFAEQLLPDQLQKICQQLVNPSGDDAQVLRLQTLFQLLDEGEVALVRRCAANPADTDATREAAKLLNSLCLRGDWFEREEFREFFGDRNWFFKFLFGVSRDQQLEDLLDRYRAQPSDALRQGLNELLMAATFAGEFSSMRKTMIPLEIWSEIDVRPQSLAATDGFMIWMKAGLIAGIFVSSPWVFYQLWSFVAAGLYPTEKRYVHLYLPISLALFFSGIAMAFIFVFDPVLAFLFSFNAQMGIAVEPRINEWLSFVLFLPLGFGVAFQLPLVMLFLYRLGIISVQQYVSKWRIAIMVIFVIAMLLTPAEPISMLLLAAPLTVLYFLGIGLCLWLPGRSAVWGES